MANSLRVGDHLLERLGVARAEPAAADNGKPAREAEEVAA